MKKLSLFLFLIFLFQDAFSPSRCWSEGPVSDKVDTIIQRGVDLVHQDKYDEGIAEFKKIVDSYPDEPLGYFFMAAAYQNLIDDYRNEKYRREFEKYIELAIAKGKDKLSQSDSSAEQFFYLGGAYGYRGIYRSVRGNWWGAYKDARKAKSFLEKALELKPDLYDAYFGLGAYHYWASVKSKLLSWLPFIGDDRKKGIYQLNLAVTKGKYTSLESKYSLLRVYNEEKNYNMVLKLSEELKGFFEYHPFRLWNMGFAYIGLKRWDEALKTFQTLLSYFKSSPYYNLVAEMECQYWMGNIYYQKGGYKKSLEIVNFVLINEENVKESDYAQPIVKQAKDLNEKILKKLSDK
jgi:tetratricopeptide (TPR) repeat protein